MNILFPAIAFARAKIDVEQIFSHVFTSFPTGMVKKLKIRKPFPLFNTRRKPFPRFVDILCKPSIDCFG